jgi:hypothetical protein
MSAHSEKENTASNLENIDMPENRASHQRKIGVKGLQKDAKGSLSDTAPNSFPPDQPGRWLPTVA